MSKKLSFTRDSGLEKFCSDAGLAFEYRTVDLSKVDAANTTYQTRKDAFGESKDLVSEYSEKLERGVVFPTLLLVVTPIGELFICCGKHRHKAARKEKYKTAENVLVVTLSSDEAECQKEAEKLRVVSRLDNNRNGWRIDRSELYDGLASDIVAANGGPDAGRPTNALTLQICKRHGITRIPNGVRDRVSSILVQAKCRELKITPPANLEASHELHQLTNLDGWSEVAREAARFDGKSLGAVLRHIRHQKMNTSEAVAHIKDAAAGYAPTSESKRPTKVDQFRLTMNSAINLLAAIKSDSSLQTDATATEIENQLERVLVAVEETCSSLKTGGRGC